MTTYVTITGNNVSDAYGQPLTVGTTYALTDDFGKSVVQSGRGEYAPPAYLQLAPAAETDVAGSMAVIVASAGDSRHGGAYVNSYSGAANSTIDLAVGDTVTYASGPQYHLEYFAGGALDVREFAETGAFMTPRPIGSTINYAESQLEQILTNTPEDCIVLPIISVNDRGPSGLVPSDTIIQYGDAAAEAVTRTGRRLLLPLEPPQKDAYWTAAMQLSWKAYVESQVALAAANPSRVRTADLISVAIDGAGTVLPDTPTGLRAPYSDDVHFRYKMAMPSGLAYYRAMGDWLIPGSFQRAMAADDALGVLNLVTNPLLTGVGGTTDFAAGVAPDNWEADRNAANSWDGVFIWGPEHYNRADSLVLTVGDRYSTPTIAYKDYDYLCITAGTCAVGEPVLSQTLFADTADGSATVKTVPKFSDFDGRTCVLMYGLGTAANTKAAFQQDITMAAAGLAVGDVVSASIYHASLLPSYGCSMELRAMTGVTKISSAIGLCQNFGNVSMVGTAPMKGKMIAAKNEGLGGYTIPAAADTLRFRWMALSRITVQSCHLVTLPVLKQV